MLILHPVEFSENSQSIEHLGLFDKENLFHPYRIVRIFW